MTVPPYPPRWRPTSSVLVADAGLGTINAVRLTAEALDCTVRRRAEPLRPSSDLHERNREWLRDRTGSGSSPCRAERQSCLPSSPVDSPCRK